MTMTASVTMTARAVQNDPRPDPPEETNQIRSDFGRHNYSGGRRQIFSPRNRFRRVGLDFPPLKVKKPEPTKET